MKCYKKHVIHFTVLALLTLMLVLGLTSCGSGNGDRGNSAASDTDSGSLNEEIAETDDEITGRDTETPLPATALEESEAWLLYSDGSYAEMLVHVPEGEVSVQLVKKDGTEVKVDGERVFFNKRKLVPGWIFVNTNQIPDDYAIADLALTLIWQNGEKTADGTYPSVLITEFGDSCTEDELRARGFVVWDGHYGVMLDARTTYGSGSSTELDAPSFGLFFELYFYGEDKNVIPAELAGQLAFFAGDGTPLENYFEGYDSIEIEVNSVSVYALLYRSDGAAYDEAQYKEMCNELRACEPYMVFTGRDGAIQKYPMFQE